MSGLIVLVVACMIFAFGVLIGIRCQEVNLQGRERRLAKERGRVNAQIRALKAHHEVNSLIWHAQNELRQAALLEVLDLPAVIDQTLDSPAERITKSGPDSALSQC